MRVCYTANGYAFYVDDEDYDMVNHYTWCDDGNGYLKTSINRRCVRLHRLLMNPPKGIEVDHVDGIRANNQKNNLRNCFPNQNKFNLSPRKNCSSGYKGVCWSKQNKKWMAYIQFNFVKINIGGFESEESAAIAYNEYAIKLFGEYARLNVIT